MTETGGSDAGLVQSQFHMRLSHKTVFEHFGGIVRQWAYSGSSALAVFATLWMLASTASYYLDVNLKGTRFYVAAVAASLLVAAFGTIRRYLRQVPSGFDGESASVCRIAHLQRRGWEFRLTKQLLADALADLDEELTALGAERVFVPMERALDAQAYIAWVQLATSNMLRMVEVAKNVLILDFAAALSVEDFDARPMAIRQVVRRIRQLYQDSIAFERSVQEIRPPEGLEQAHELASGWADPIRGGAHQLFDFLNAGLAVDKKDKNARIQFTLVIDAPENLDPFVEEVTKQLG